MLTYEPVWPTKYITVYFAASFVTLLLCIVICVAIARTKKTPYPTRILCIGLLCYNCLFLPCACAAKLFTHEGSTLLRHLSRGFQMAAQVIVAAMAFERFFVLNWPYVYLKTPKRLIRKMCLGIIALSFIQYLLVKGVGCYARGRYLNCQDGNYFTVMCLLGFVISFSVFIQIYTVIRRLKILAMKQYKGTIASFMYLVNSAVFMGLYLSLVLYYSLPWATNDHPAGWLSQIADAIYVFNCIIDALIYGLWFKEVRMEILKIISVVFPCVKTYISKMRTELYATSYEQKTICNFRKNNNV